MIKKLGKNLKQEVNKKMEFYDDVERDFQEITAGKFSMQMNPILYQEALKEFRENIELMKKKAKSDKEK